MIKYINIKSKNGIETIDEFDSEELGMNALEFRNYLVHMLHETAMVYRNSDNEVYLSSRCTNEWKER